MHPVVAFIYNVKSKPVSYNENTFFLFFLDMQFHGPSAEVRAAQSTRISANQFAAPSRGTQAEASRTLLSGGSVSPALPAPALAQ